MFRTSMASSRRSDGKGLKMKITVLGGSAACPNPGQGSSSYILTAGSMKILLDCGPDTLSELRKHVELDEIDHILISHVHADHTIDLIPYRYGLRLIPGLRPGPIPLWLPPNGMDFLDRVAYAFAAGGDGPEGFFASNFTPQEYQPDDGLTLGEIQISFHRTNHPVACWAMRIMTPDGLVVYMADTGPQDNLVEIACDADILICEGTVIDFESVRDSIDRPHISAYEAGVIANNANVKKFILTHYFAKHGVDRYVAEATRGFERDVILATPGLTVEHP
jgi:ribonuclease BN (tRNA processing enzyme)